MNRARSRAVFMDEEKAVRAGLIDPAVPLVPVIEITCGVPVEVPTALLRPPPCEKPLEFLGRLAQESSMAVGIFGERWNVAAPFTGPVGDDLGDLQRDINAAGKLLFTTLYHALGTAELPSYRFLLNRIDNAWMDFNAHSCKVAPGIEITQARALREKVSTIAAALPGLPPTKPDWAAPEFGRTCKSMLLGARLVRRDDPLHFEFTGIPMPVRFDAGSSPTVLGGTLCTIVDQTCGKLVHLLESNGIEENIPDEQGKLRDTIRAKFPSLPTKLPQLYIASHYQVTSRNKRLVPLEEGREEDAILDRTLQPGEALFVSIKSWGGDLAKVTPVAAYPDTPLPEARDDLVRRLRVACQESTRDRGLANRTILVPPDLPGGILQSLKDVILSQAAAANAHRTFIVTFLPEGKRDGCLPGGRPTNPRKESPLQFQNTGGIPLRVRYIPAQKTYAITISFVRASLLCHDGVNWKEAGPEKWPKALAALLKPTTCIEETPVPAAMRGAEVEGKGAGSTVTFDVVLRAPVAAPVKFIEDHIKEFPRSNAPKKGGRSKRPAGGKKAKPPEIPPKKLPEKVEQG